MTITSAKCGRFLSVKCWLFVSADGRLDAYCSGPHFACYNVHAVVGGTSQKCC